MISIPLPGALPDVRPAVPVRGILHWTMENLEGLAIGALVAAAIVGVMLVLRWLGQKLVERHPNCADWKGVFGAVLAKTGLVFMIAAAIDIVINYAPVPARIDRLAGIFFIIAASLQAAIWARELILGAVQSRVGEEPGESTLGNAMSIVRVLVSITVFALALLVILDNLGVNVTTLVAGFGIGGIAIGLAAKDVFSDLFAALAIVFDRPFRRGDTVRYGTTTGTVERIGLKTTRLRAITGEQIIMANTKLLEQEMHNLADGRMRRGTIQFGLTYQTQPETLGRIADIVDEAIKPIKSARLVRCLVKNFGASSIDCELVYDDRVTDADTLARHRSAILVDIVRIFAREGIEFAYPTQTSFTAAPDGTLVMPYPTR